MDPVARHREMIEGRAQQMRDLHDAQMGRGPEPPQIDWSVNAPPPAEQVPPCPNCGQRHLFDRGCPHAHAPNTFERNAPA